jgi:lysyl-tRNA synthetase class 2
MGSVDWQPTASREALAARAKLLADIRQFFAERQVMEVDTPVLASFGVTDPHMPLFRTEPDDSGRQYYLQSSPEYAMKRLLAAGYGPIYQLGKAFRGAETGSRHNPEFTMLEWYRPGFDERQLMDEVAELIAATLAAPNAVKLSYREAFIKLLACDPHTAADGELLAYVQQRCHYPGEDLSRDDCLNLLMAQLIEPVIAQQQPVFIYDYPASQAALAQLGVDAQGQTVARRFELYYQGMELANGYFELLDVTEQAQRMADEQAQRQALSRPAMAKDYYLLAALEAGLPSCAGVALGFDRLLMLQQQASHIEQVLAFPAHRI